MLFGFAHIPQGIGDEDAVSGSDAVLLENHAHLFHRARVHVLAHHPREVVKEPVPVEKFADRPRRGRGNDDERVLFGKSADDIRDARLYACLIFGARLEQLEILVRVHATWQGLYAVVNIALEERPVLVRTKWRVGGQETAGDGRRERGELPESRHLAEECPGDEEREYRRCAAERDCLRHGNAVDAFDEHYFRQAEEDNAVDQEEQYCGADILKRRVLAECVCDDEKENGCYRAPDEEHALARGDEARLLLEEIACRREKR